MTLSADRLSYSYSRVRLKPDTTSQRVRLKPDTTTEFTLRDVSVRIAPGSLTGLLGPNGCGKTTLLKLLAGVLKPELGSVRLGDREIRTLSPARPGAADRGRAAGDASGIRLHGDGDGAHGSPSTPRCVSARGPADIAIAREAMTATGITHLAGRAYMTLSGGEKQRVVIASALAQQPKVLLLDEPTASLDLGYQLEIASLLKQLNRERGVTMVLATHDLNLAASVCDTLVLVREDAC
jgi:iron complex transport system ATP-binding protein